MKEDTDACDIIITEMSLILTSAKFTHLFLLKVNYKPITSLNSPNFYTNYFIMGLDPLMT